MAVIGGMVQEKDTYGAPPPPPPVAGAVPRAIAGRPDTYAATPIPNPDFVNTAQPDPYLTDLAGRIKSRLDNPRTIADSPGRAIDMAGSKLRDLAAGQKTALQGRFARLGTLGSGAQQAVSSSIDENTRRELAGQAADISLGRERDIDKVNAENDAFMLNSAGALGKVGEAARSDRSLALQQWAEADAARRAQEAQDLARQSAIMGLLSQATVTSPGLTSQQEIEQQDTGYSADPWGADYQRGIEQTRAKYAAQRRPTVTSSSGGRGMR